MLEEFDRHITSMQHKRQSRREAADIIARAYWTIEQFKQEADVVESLRSRE
jgi:hypothetical protein